MWKLHVSPWRYSELNLTRSRATWSSCPCSEKELDRMSPQPKLFCDSVKFSVFLPGQFLYIWSFGGFRKFQWSRHMKWEIMVSEHETTTRIISCTLWCYWDASAHIIFLQTRAILFSTVFFSAGDLNSGSLRQRKGICALHSWSEVIVWPYGHRWANVTWVPLKTRTWTVFQ